jgi:glycosyltransferase involved in cell wall biosynthesis
MEVNKISVITINFNNLAGLVKTINSVVCQTYPVVEYIIVDGGSTDGSLEYLQKIDAKIYKWISEPDSGIYNAMNKAIAMASGEYLIFMNSGDYFYSDNVLTNVFDEEQSADIIYGRSIREHAGEKTIWPYVFDVDKGDLYKYSLHHQSMFFKRELFGKYGGYNEDLKVVADWEFCFRLYLQTDTTFMRIDDFISVFDLDGLSQSEKGAKLDFEERKLVRNKLVSKKMQKVFDAFFELQKEHKSLLKKKSVSTAIKYGNIIQRLKNILK